jgi:hypothetical protein
MAAFVVVLTGSNYNGKWSEPMHESIIEEI